MNNSTLNVCIVCMIYTIVHYIYYLYNTLYIPYIHIWYIHIWCIYAHMIYMWYILYIRYSIYPISMCVHIVYIGYISYNYKMYNVRIFLKGGYTVKHSCPSLLHSGLKWGSRSLLDSEWLLMTSLDLPLGRGRMRPPFWSRNTHWDSVWISSSGVFVTLLFVSTKSGTSKLH